MVLLLSLYGVLLALAIFAPMRWALVSYLMLSCVDFYTADAGIGIFNSIRGIVCPLILLWRLRDYGGHTRIVTAPIAWLMLTGYAAIASLWSLFGLSAIKLVGEMTGSFLICMVFLRAGKGNFLTPKIVLPVTLGILSIAILRTAYVRVAGDIFSKMSGDTPDRFTAFTTAQAFAALLTALYAIAVISRTLRPAVRYTLCLSIIVALILDGSRLWLIALVVATILAMLISDTGLWAKIMGVGAALVAVLGIIAAAQPIVDALQSAHQYRIAAAITAAYEGNEKDTGLGTVVLRRRLDARAIEMIRSGSVIQLLFGHGTSNGRLVRGDLNKGIGDPNRAVHNEWLRIMYEWGFVGTILWILFVGSLMVYAYEGLRQDKFGFAKPLFIYVPAFCIGVSGENIIAGAGHAENVGLLLLIGIAGIAHRMARFNSPPYSSVQEEYLQLSARGSEAQRHAHKEFAGSSDGADNAPAVLRGFPGITSIG
jgi:O-antigen ligase